MKNSLKCILFSAVILAASCSAKTDVFIQPSGDAVVTIDIQPSAVLDSLLENVSGFTEEEKAENKSIFNTEEIKTQLEEKGVKVLSISTQSFAGITAKLKITGDKMNDENSFVKIDMEEGAFLFEIKPDSIKEFVNILSADDKEYIELLMAPVLTGEKLDGEGYIAVIKAAYGEKLAAELKKSMLKVSVTCPKKVRDISVKPFGKGQKNGNKAYANIPLVEVLCVNEPIFVEVTFIP